MKTIEKEEKKEFTSKDMCIAFGLGLFLGFLIEVIIVLHAIS